MSHTLLLLAMVGHAAALHITSLDVPLFRKDRSQINGRVRRENKDDSGHNRNRLGWNSAKNEVRTAKENLKVCETGRSTGNSEMCEARIERVKISEIVLEVEERAFQELEERQKDDCFRYADKLYNQTFPHNIVNSSNGAPAGCILYHQHIEQDELADHVVYISTCVDTNACSGEICNGCEILFPSFDCRARAVPLIDDIFKEIGEQVTSLNGPKMDKTSFKQALEHLLTQKLCRELYTNVELRTQRPQTNGSALQLGQDVLATQESFGLVVAGVVASLTALIQASPDGRTAESVETAPDEMLVPIMTATLKYMLGNSKDIEDITELAMFDSLKEAVFETMGLLEVKNNHLTLHHITVALHELDGKWWKDVIDWEHRQDGWQIVADYISQNFE